MKSIKLDHGGHHPLERRRAGQVLKPAHGRLRAEVRFALGRPTDRYLERRIGAERVAVVGVWVAGRDQQHPEADHLRHGVVNTVRRPRILDAAGQALGDAEPALDVRQRQHARVRGQATAVEREDDRLAGSQRREGAPFVPFHDAFHGGSG